MTPLDELSLDLPGVTLFLRERIESQSLTAIEAGIAKRFLDKKSESLSSRQAWVLKGAIEPFAGMKCRMCQEHIPLDEAVCAKNFNEGYCGRCAYSVSNDERRQR